MFRSLTLFVLALVVAASAAQAVTLDEVIQNNIDARGGIEKIRALKTLKFTGTMQTMGGEMSFVQWYKGNSKMRMDMKSEAFSMTQATDGIIAWGDNPFSGGSGPQVITGPQADNLHRQADFAGDLIDHKEKGLTLELTGSEDLDGMTAYVVKVTDPTGDSHSIYIDAITWLEVKMVRKGAMMGQEMTLEVLLSNYQDIGGVIVPMQVDIRSDGMDLVSMTRNSFEANIPLDDEMFSLPSKE